jgi:hypothetical protein
MEIALLERIINESWDKNTCYPPLSDEWNAQNPALGQCAVTALVVQDYLGGELLYCRHNYHYWNRLPDKEEIDFTKEQFPKGTIICLDEIRLREHILNSQAANESKTPVRYFILKMRVDRRANL